MTVPVIQPDAVEQERLRQVAELTAEQGKGWEAECRPGSASCHELLDRTACVANAEWYRLAGQAAAALHDLYQRVGAEHLSADQ
jgi:hypothetical protein